ncbi:hypothetical protein [Phnomibacter sp. MR]|uniref:hypothetical protein n=1 Tax=Phnomibacter sp. MR TaxID=3042318 RepID=UPI003A811DBB
MNQNNNPLYGGFRVALIVIIVLIVGTVLYRVYKAINAGAQVVGDGLGGVVVENQTGIPVARQGVLRIAAQDAHRAIWGEKVLGLWLSPTEDEDAFIEAANRAVTAAEAKLMAQYYKTIAGASMLADAKKYLNSTEQSRITPVVFTNLF